MRVSAISCGLSSTDWDGVNDCTGTWDEYFDTEVMQPAAVFELCERLEQSASSGGPWSPAYLALPDLLRAAVQRGEVAGPDPVPAVVSTGVPPAPALVPDHLLLRKTLRYQALPALAQTIRYYDLPPGHTRIMRVTGARLPLRHKNLVLLTTALRAYYGVNREDITGELRSAYAAAVPDDAEAQLASWDRDPGVVAGKESVRPGYKSTDAFAPTPGTYPPHWPSLPAGALPVHESSLEVFARFGLPGHAFTGLVAFAGRDETTYAPTDGMIVLFPTQSTGDYLEWGVREHPPEGGDPEVLRAGRVLDQRPGEYTTHDARSSSHYKLADHVERNNRYAALHEEGLTYQASGLTIGFTVIKGGSETSHKYTFKSISSNDPIFGLISPAERTRLTAEDAAMLRVKRSGELPDRGEGDIPDTWGAKIIQSLEAALPRNTNSNAN
jgi:hypothetical protein